MDSIPHAQSDELMTKHRLRNVALVVLPLGLFPSWLGIILGVTIWLTLHKVVPHLQELEHRKHTAVSAADLVSVVECLCLCLSAGLTIPESFAYTGKSQSSRAHQQLLQVVTLHELGQDLPTALAELERLDSKWLAASRILSASIYSGAPALEALDALLNYLREEAHSEVTTRIRAVGVKCVLPLGLCFLPAFILLTVVPLIAQYISQLHW